MTAGDRNALEAWRSIVGLVEGLAEGLSEEQLDRGRGKSGMTIRETVHHVAEANLVAGSIVIAALGSPECVYDWSWMMPFGKWMERLRYDRKPVAPALQLIEALNAYVAAQVEPLEDGLDRIVRLRDEPGAEPHAVSVAEVLLQEVDHARQHVEEARALRGARSE